MKASNLVTLFIVSLFFAATVIGCGSNAPVGGDNAPCDGATADTATSGSDGAGPCDLTGAICSSIEGQINSCGRIFTCCKDAVGVLRLQERVGCGTAPAADAGVETGTDTGPAPADTAPPDTSTDTGVTDTAPSPPFDGGPISLTVWIDPAKYPGCSTVVWDNVGKELVSDPEKPLVMDPFAWRGWAASEAKCGGAYKTLSAPLGSNAETAGYKQITLNGVDMLKKSAICKDMFGFAGNKLAIPIDKPDLSCP